MPDDESTHPIDVEALRAAAKAKKRADEADELYPSDEVTATNLPSEEHEEHEGHARDPHSVTRVEAASPRADLPGRLADTDEHGVDLESLATQTRLPHPTEDVAAAFAAFAASVATDAPATQPPPPSTASPASPASIVEIDSADLESVDELHELRSSGELPRFALGTDDDVGDAPTHARLPHDSGPTATELRPPVQAEPPPAEARPPAKKLSGIAAFVPPAPVGRPIVPAYANDPDPDEKQLQDEGSFQALLDLYKLRLVDAATRTERVALLHKIGSVLERLGRHDDAFDELARAFDEDPTDDALAESLDRVGKQTSRIGELAERAKKNLHTADPEARLALLGHIVHWLERMLGRGAETPRFVAEIERLDKGHPVLLRRAAQNAAATGDARTQRDMLIRALDRTTRRQEKVHLHLALAGTWASSPEASRHYEAALSLDPTSIVALQGIERLGREQEKHAQVEWALERQTEAALTSSEKVDALLRLAELQESKFLRRERAAELLEQVIVLEPANPSALKALERCYHALRQWSKLARVLRARAENTYDKKTQSDLLELAAEVYEAKLGDATQAIEAYRDLLHVEPRHRRALGDLARLHEKIGDWGNVATFKSRLAELAPTKRQASRELVALGDFLNAPERDAIAAQLQYERAATIDPTNAAAWEALQKLAVLAGDDRKVVHCLEQRAKALDGPRQRASVLVELARFQEERGDPRAARAAWAEAIASDAANEAAAAVMLDVYTREESWADAAPLCELLVNAAVRDKDHESLFTRLRLQTRIAAALGDPDRAMTAAIAALEARPDDADAQADLLAVCAQCRSVPTVVARAKDWLARIAAGPISNPQGIEVPGLSPDALVRLAQLQRDAGEADAAAHTLERARDADPENPEILRELAEVYLAQGDWPRACKMLVDLARNPTSAASADQQFALFAEAGEIWSKKANEPEKAASLFEEARSIKPHDHGVLHTLMTIYGEIGEWTRLSSVLESIAQIQESPERKAKSLFAMAVVVREKVGDARRAAELFDEVLDIDKKRLEAFEEVVRTLTAVKDWEGLERAYRRMIARIEDDDAPNLEFALFQQLGLVYRDRLDDAARAYESFDAAARIKPDDTEVRKIVTELLVVSDNLDEAVVRTRSLIERDPHDPELYAELYELFLRQHYFDKAWCAVNVLASLREPTPEQRRFHEDYAPMQLAEVPGQIVELAWRSHVFHVDLDPTLTELFAFMTPAVARMRHAQLRPEHAVGRPFTAVSSRYHDALRQTFADAAEILGQPPPDLLLGDPSAPVAIQPALAPYGALLVSVPALEARVDSLVFLVGKRLAEQRRELTARAFFPSVPDLTALLAAAVRVSRREGAKDAAGAALDAGLSAVMTNDEREGIRAVVMRAAMEGGLVDVKRWSQAADLSSMRAGLLLAGDVEPARRFIVAEPVSAADLPPRERIGELYKFATSDLYSDLRGAIGVAVVEE